MHRSQQRIPRGDLIMKYTLSGHQTILINHHLLVQHSNIESAFIWITELWRGEICDKASKNYHVSVHYGINCMAIFSPHSLVTSPVKSRSYHVCESLKLNAELCWHYWYSIAARWSRYRFSSSALAKLSQLSRTKGFAPQSEDELDWVEVFLK